ncbi:UNVERIFIED_CONTAM: hypothetical protein Sradi_7206900 [Sesamum radiatum]|uniref:DUF4283 domain-containing protein n=1 Tax=Sesamum radiatum TaxID=300843 RepID=A0AAW2IP23_SESRA
MLPKGPNSLCPLSHSSHTDSTHTTHTEILTTQSCGEPEAPVLGGDSPSVDEAEHPGGASAIPEDSSSNLNGDFDFDEFYELATRVLNGDSESLTSLQALKIRWELKFKTRRNPLKPVIGRPSTPFRPRISLLPRRFVRTDLETLPANVLANVSAAPTPTVHEEHPEHPAIYVGTVKLQASTVDNIAGAFLQSSRKTLHFVPPTKQNGEIIIRPTKEVVDNGSKKWQTTAVGYCLGRRPYFPQFLLVWKGLQQVSATSSGFFFFRFTTRFAMEDVIEGGPWLFQGQPIVLQFWEQGMSLRRQKHTQIPVWIRLRHLPMEYWTEEGLSTVASGIGLHYTRIITCSRLDYARVCVLLDFSSALPKHLVVISPTLRNGKEDPKRVDVEYEWLPQRCSHCCSLGHVANLVRRTQKRFSNPR